MEYAALNAAITAIQKASYNSGEVAGEHCGQNACRARRRISLTTKTLFSGQAFFSLCRQPFRLLCFLICYAGEFQIFCPQRSPTSPSGLLWFSIWQIHSR